MWQKSKNIYHLLVSFLANVYYGFPGKKLTIIGITGTSGKTTTAHMVYEIVKSAGYKVSLLSSIKAIIHGEEFDTGFHVTTPDPHTLPKYLRKAVDAGDRYFVLEVSSHALDQNRAAFVHFRVGVLTTLAHEHLDYHKTFFNYAKAKFKLLHAANTAIIPISLFKGEEENKSVGKINNKQVKDLIRYNHLENKLITFGLDKGDQTQKKWNFHLLLPGDYNIMNALAAASVGECLKIPHKVIKESLEKFSAIPGRFEEIKNDKGFRIIIDFAHKPDALLGILQTAKKEISKNGRVIVMYGCASQRDVLKRPIMGKISGELADITVLTDEDPRFEEPIKIINEIAEGCLQAGAKEYQISNIKDHISKHQLFFKIPNRQEAINFIIRNLAKRGDIILLCGKGHEKSMNYNGIETPWNEHEAVKKALIGNRYV